MDNSTCQFHNVIFDEMTTGPASVMGPCLLSPRLMAVSLLRDGTTCTCQRFRLRARRTDGMFKLWFDLSMLYAEAQQVSDIKDGENTCWWRGRRTGSPSDGVGKSCCCSGDHGQCGVGGET